MKSVIKPGIRLIDMCETLENTVRRLIDERGLEAGVCVCVCVCVCSKINVS